MKKAIESVRQLIALPRAERQAVIVARGRDKWLSCETIKNPGEGIYIHDPAQARGASLSPATGGGRFLIENLCD